MTKSYLKKIEYSRYLKDVSRNNEEIVSREVDRDNFIENVQKEEGNLKVKKNRKGCLDEEEKNG